jgi:hypothetical protein
MTDKLLRCSEHAWRVLRKIAYKKETSIKSVIDDITNGNMNPSEFNLDI